MQFEIYYYFQRKILKTLKSSIKLRSYQNKNVFNLMKVQVVFAFSQNLKRASIVVLSKSRITVLNRGNEGHLTAAAKNREK